MAGGRDSKREVHWNYNKKANAGKILKIPDTWNLRGPYISTAEIYRAPYQSDGGEFCADPRAGEKQLTSHTCRWRVW